LAYLKQPKSAEAYVDLVDQALTETQELRASFDYEMDEASQAPAFLEPLERALRDLRASMGDGSYYFENRDLPFMRLVHRYRSAIPFAELLATINRTHREGLDISGEEAE